MRRGCSPRWRFRIRDIREQADGALEPSPHVASGMASRIGRTALPDLPFVQDGFAMMYGFIAFCAGDRPGLPPVGLVS